MKEVFNTIFMFIIICTMCTVPLVITQMNVLFWASIFLNAAVLGIYKCSTELRDSVIGGTIAMWASYLLLTYGDLPKGFIF